MLDASNKKAGTASFFVLKPVARHQLKAFVDERTAGHPCKIHIDTTIGLPANAVGDCRELH